MQRLRVASADVGPAHEIRNGQTILATLRAERFGRDAECRTGDKRYRIAHEGWQSADVLSDESGEVIAELRHSFLGRGTLTATGEPELNWRRRLPLGRELCAPDGGTIAKLTRRITLRRDFDLLVDPSAFDLADPDCVAVLALLAHSMLRRERAGSG